MTRSVNHAQRPRFEFQLGFVNQSYTVIVFDGIGELTHALVELAHERQLVRRNACPYEKLSMFFILEAPDAMACLPIVHKDFGVLRFVPQRPCETTMIFVRMSQHDAANV